ncbi:MAG: hypothetical protein FWB85_04025 [Chitinispirillia bacterium]|nr:hypothetical protein [Chitinispirillia bacterium]MCL2241530.1 hypothetical protein [Chitinispirillia bacterium]
MRCQICGAQVEDMVAACPECGAKILPINVGSLKKLPEESRWYYILNRAMGFPGIKIDRCKFLRDKFSPRYDETTVANIIEEGTGRASVPPALLDDIAAEVIKGHKLLATGASAAAGLPGGFGLLATVPADMAQYYFHSLQLAQKLAYLYGYPDLEKNGKDDFLVSMTLFIGVMNDIGVAVKGVREFSKILAEGGGYEVSRMAMTKGAIYPVVKQVARIMGVSVTKNLFAKSFSKIIPGIGALASGGITLIMFSYEAERLREGLREDFVAQWRPEEEE